jgi:hypothetical protein
VYSWKHSWGQFLIAGDEKIEKMSRGIKEVPKMVQPLDNPSMENTVAQNEMEWINTPFLNQRFVIKHPRVLLSFLRFIDQYNELAAPEEVYMLPAIPQRIVRNIFSHVSFVNPPAEFLNDINELRQRVEAHMDLSELPQPQ